jgi:hypothetical protein
MFPCPRAWWSLALRARTSAGRHPVTAIATAASASGRRPGAADDMGGGAQRRAERPVFERKGPGIVVSTALGETGGRVPPVYAGAPNADRMGQDEARSGSPLRYDRRLRALVVALVPRAACPIRAIDELDGSRAGVWVPSRVAALNCHEKL